MAASSSLASSSSPSSGTLIAGQTHDRTAPGHKLTSQPASEHDMYGSRARVLKAAHLCCQRQGLLTVVDSNQAAYMLCEIHHFAQNDLCLLMKNNLKETNYGEFLQLAWGRKISSSLHF